MVAASSDSPQPAYPQRDKCPCVSKATLCLPGMRGRWDDLALRATGTLVFGAQRSDRVRCVRWSFGTNSTGGDRLLMRLVQIVALPACNHVGRASHQLVAVGRIAALDFVSFAKPVHFTTRAATCHHRRHPSGRCATNDLEPQPWSDSWPSTTGYGDGIL